MVFLECCSEEKTSILLYLLRSLIKADQQSVIFVATKHHVEYLNMVSVCGLQLMSESKQDWQFALEIDSNQFSS